MKSLLRNLLPSVAGLCLGATAAMGAPWPPAQGDLVLGVQATGGQGSSSNVLFNLGPAHALRDTPNAGTLVNLDAELSAAFGNDWFTRTDLYFGLFGNFSSAPTTGFGSASAVNGDPSRTIYLSRNASSPGASTLWSGYFESGLGIAASRHSGQITAFAALTANGNAVATLEQSANPVQWNNGWTTWNPVPGAAYSTFAGGIQTNFGAGGDLRVVDVQRLVPTNTGASPTVPTPLVGVVITSIAITEGGDLIAGTDFFQLTLAAPVNGTVTGAVDGQVFGSGQTANLTATPATGYLFGGWTGDVPGGDVNNNPLALLIDADKSVAATFVKDNNDSDNDGISNHDELVIHGTDPNVANSYTGPLVGAPFTTPNGETVNFESTLALGGAEISAFDPASQRLFVTSGAGLQVIDLSDPAAPALLSTIDLSAAPFSAVSNDVSSVSVFNGVVAASCLNADKEAAGSVVFLTAATAGVATGHLGTVAVGIHPDHVVFTPNGQKLLVANEGEWLNSDGGPGVTPGSVSVIDVSGGFAAPPVTNVGFGSFDAQVATLKAAGVRIFGSELPSNDLEPEYIAVAPDSTTAIVTLQENNAVAFLNLVTNTFTGIVPLGTKDFSSLLADFSDQDGPGGTQVSLLRTGLPVQGFYMPDGVASFSQGGSTFYVTANEGDDRDDFRNPNETSRVSALGGLDGTEFPNAAELTPASVLGRHTVTKVLEDGSDLPTPATELLSIGARSFSIWDDAGNLVYDSGDLIERTVASYGKNDGGLGTTTQAIFDDTRSDNKGPEPEGVAVAEINGAIYAFVTLERSNGVMVFDITDTNNVTVEAFLRGVDDVSPEGVIIVPAVNSPNEKTLVIVSNEVSNTVSVFSFDADTTTDSDGNGFTDFQEAQLAAIAGVVRQVGEAVSIDLGAVLFPLTPPQTLQVLGLPPGLSFNATTGIISGTILGENGAVSGEIRIRSGATTVASLPFNLTVVPFQLLGAYEVLIENGSPAIPVGKARLTVTGPRTYTATLELQGQVTRRRSFGGTTMLTSPIVVEFPTGKFGIPGATTQPAVSVSFTLSGASDLVSGSTGASPATTGLGVNRGFRLAKPGRAPRQAVTVAFENVVPGDRDNTPGGTGYATGSADGKGNLPLRGALGDAQAFTTSLAISQTNQAVVFFQPYANKSVSFFGGIMDVGNLGLPGRGASTQSDPNVGLMWRKAAGATDKSYQAGIGVATPLDIDGRVSKWFGVGTAEAMALSLGLNLRQLYASYVPTTDPAGTGSTLPTILSLRNGAAPAGFPLVRLAPSTSVPFSGRAFPSNGSFSGTLTLPAPATRTLVNGVFLQDETFDPQIGIGLIRIPVTVPGIVGAFETATVEFENVP